MKLRLSAFVVAVVGVTAVTGCDDPTALKAEFNTLTDTLQVFALNGTSSSLPAAIRTRLPQTVRIGAGFQFDLAFDINEAGEVVAHTVKAVANELVPTHNVGLQLVPGPFDAVTRAPTSGFTYDSSKVVPLGEILLVDVFDMSCSAFSLRGQNIRSKIQIDSVNMTTRAIYLRILSNPNCGFRDLVPGLPKD